MLLEIVDGIVRLSGKETHEKKIVCVDGKESCGVGASAAALILAFYDKVMIGYICKDNTTCGRI